MAPYSLLEAVRGAVAGAQTEIILFTLAVLCHYFFFNAIRWPRYRSHSSKTSLASCDGSLPQPKGPPRTVEPSSREVANRKKAAVDRSQRVAQLMRAAAAQGNMAEAEALFESCVHKPPGLYNALLDCHITCNNIDGALRVAADAIIAGSADSATHISLIKVHLRIGDIQKSRNAVHEMRQAGFVPNCVLYNELLDATIYRNIDVALEIVDEMEETGVKPNQITASILMKGVHSSSRPSLLERALELIEKMDDSLDDILLASVVEACVRTQRLDILQRLLSQQGTSKKVEMKSCQAYGSLIRAYGVLQDIDGVWTTWREMRKKRIELTSITVGCTVEAIVMNSNPEAGYDLVRELMDDPGTRPLVNSVIYGSLLKGFSHKKQFHRVWAIYQEMLKEGTQRSITTYNTLVDACARCCEMPRVSEILNDMMANQIEPNVITYGSIVKGYCQEGKINQALEVMEGMRSNDALRPDEHTYNTVISGCARVGLYDNGVALLKEMCQAGIKPSNFTLSVVVKLASRARKLDKAFELCEELASKYHIRLNVHVYNNLIQACIFQKEPRMCFEVVERMLKQRVRLDVRSYTLLLRACVEARQARDAAGFIRAATGLQVHLPRIEGAFPSLLQPQGGLPSEILTEVLEGIAVRCGDSILAVELLKQLRKVPGCKLDPKLSGRLISA